MTEYVAVKVDNENNAESWWDELRERFPAFAKSLERNGAAVIAAPLWDTLADLPGFTGGPEYAPTPLIDCGSDGQRWADVVAQRHQLFEILS